MARGSIPNILLLISKIALAPLVRFLYGYLEILEWERDERGLEIKKFPSKYKLRSKTVNLPSVARHWTLTPRNAKQIHWHTLRP